MKKMEVQDKRNLITAIVVTLLGILFCCSLSIGIKGLSIIIGSALILTGLIFIIREFVCKKGYFSIEGIMGVATISLGILFLVEKLAGIIFAYIPWLLIVWGVTVFIDAFLAKKFRNDSKINFIFKLIASIIAIVLGVCLEFIDSFQEYASIMLGVVLILLGIYMLVSLITSKKTIKKSSEITKETIIVEEEKKDSK